MISYTEKNSAIEHLFNFLINLNIFQVNHGSARMLSNNTVSKSTVDNYHNIDLELHMSVIILKTIKLISKIFKEV